MFSEFTYKNIRTIDNIIINIEDSVAAVLPLWYMYPVFLISHILTNSFCLHISYFIECRIDISVEQHWTGMLVRGS